MKIDLRIIPIFLLALLFLVDLGCLLNNMPPDEVFGTFWQFLLLHGILGLASGLCAGSIMKEQRDGTD